MFVSLQLKKHLETAYFSSKPTMLRQNIDMKKLEGK